ncbi:MAG: 4Fe-4S dicluster domain-containing protein [Thermoplasmatota archaeon]
MSGGEVGAVGARREAQAAVAIDVRGGEFNAALAEALGALLDRGVVGALLIPQEASHGAAVHQTLVRSRAGLRRPRPLSLMMAANAARFLQELSEAEPETKVGAVLRPCELRAAVELAKLNQVNRESFLLIGLDCIGTMRTRAYEREAAGARAGAGDPTKELMKRGPEALREVCRACDRFWPIEGTADLVAAHIGSELSRELFIEAQTERGREALSALEAAGYRAAQVPASRAAEIERRRSRAAELRKKWLEEGRARFGSLEGILSTLSACIRCYNCRDACPICYCKECIFDAELLKPSPGQTLRRAGRRGVLKMPQETLLFHITRLNHMVSSCVGCGMCEEACPNELPVALVFSAIGESVQKIFDYVPGRDPGEPLPLATFKEKELEEVGEK